MSFFLIDDIEQGTAKWLKWRRGVIGASEAAIIMGENRWKGRQQLIDEKRGLVEPFKGNDFTREGNLNEPHARMALEKKFTESNWVVPLRGWRHLRKPKQISDLPWNDSDYCC